MSISPYPFSKIPLPLERECYIRRVLLTSGIPLLIPDAPDYKDEIPGNAKRHIPGL